MANIYKELTWEVFDALFIKIKNRNNFILKSLMEYHPSSIQYVKYWKKLKRHCIEGLWSVDNAEYPIDINDDEYLEKIDAVKKDYRWMPGNLFFYGNFGTIMLAPKHNRAASKVPGRPIIREIDWELTYNYIEARGFSGFDLDDEYSCERNILLFLAGEDVFLSKSAINKNGDIKKYIPAREYLRKLHDRQLGLPLWNNEALDYFILGTRDFGKSFFVAQAIMLYTWLFDDAKAYTDETMKNPAKVEQVIGASLTDKSSDTVNKFFLGLNNIPGAFGKGTHMYTPSPFYKNYSGNLKPNNSQSIFEHKVETKRGDKREILGSLSSIKHVTYKVENPEAAVGSRASVSILEEIGLIENLKAIKGANQAILKHEATFKFGTQIYIGTGGNIEKIREAEEIFNNPDENECLAFENTLEKTHNKIGFFMPSIFVDNSLRDDNGNIDVKTAFERKMKLRESLEKRNSSHALAEDMMNYPMVPSEMFLRGSTSKFPVVQIRERIAELESHPAKYKNQFYYGDLEFQAESGKIYFKAGSPVKAIEAYPIKDNKNKEGCFIIYKMPKRDSTGDVIRGRYILGTDTYDDDESNTNSLGSCYVFDLFTEEIVAEFTGRPDTETFYENTRKLTMFYSAVGFHMYEQNKKGLYAYYNKKNAIHLLADTPSHLSHTHNIKISKEGNKRKGINMVNNELVNYGINLQSDWLKKQSEEGDFINLNSVYSIGYLKECLYYTQRGGNYDRISAMNMIFILREELLKYVPKRKERSDVVESNEDMKDSFFNRYKPRNTKRLFN